MCAYVFSAKMCIFGTNYMYLRTTYIHLSCSYTYMWFTSIYLVPSTYIRFVSISRHAYTLYTHKHGNNHTNVYPHISTTHIYLPTCMYRVRTRYFGIERPAAQDSYIQTHTHTNIQPHKYLPTYFYHPHISTCMYRVRIRYFGIERPTVQASYIQTHTHTNIQPHKCLPTYIYPHTCIGFELDTSASREQECKMPARRLTDASLALACNLIIQAYFCFILWYGCQGLGFGFRRYFPMCMFVLSEYSV